MGTQGGHSEGCPSVLLPRPCREKKANLLSLFSQGGGMQEEEGRRGERNWGVSEQGRMSQAERKRGWVSTSFQNRPPNISLLWLSPANGWQGPPFSPHPFISSCFFYSPATSTETMASHGIMTARCFNLAFCKHSLPSLCVPCMCVQLKDPLCNNQ